jgi:hypothetical protein
MKSPYGSAQTQAGRTFQRLSAIVAGKVFGKVAYRIRLFLLPYSTKREISNDLYERSFA